MATYTPPNYNPYLNNLPSGYYQTANDSNAITNTSVLGFDLNSISQFVDDNILLIGVGGAALAAYFLFFHNSGVASTETITRRSFR